MKESVLSLKWKTHNFNFATFKLPASNKIFYDWPLNIIFWPILYMIARL